MLRPLLFRLDPETAHRMGRTLLRRPWFVGRLAGSGLLLEDERLRVDLGGVAAPNPVGVSAGFDKDCDMADSLMRFGFGYVVSGSVMYRRRPGNPRPRLIRDPDREALYSCMGLPSLGLDHALSCLKKRRHAPVIVNLNAESFDEYLVTFEALQPFCDAVEVSLTCPNRSSDGGDYLQPEVAATLLAELCGRKQKPLFVKIPGYADEAERGRRLDLVRCIRGFPVDGVTISPGSRVKDGRLSIGQGTLTGRPLFPQTLRVIGDVYRLVGKDLAIKASGGVQTAEDAYRAIAAGATAVELLTGFIYEGWRLAANIKRGLIERLEKGGIANVCELRGSEAGLSERP